jgi:hypothetical protein
MGEQNTTATGILLALHKTYRLPRVREICEEKRRVPQKKKKKQRNSVEERYWVELLLSNCVHSLLSKLLTLVWSSCFHDYSLNQERY